MKNGSLVQYIDQNPRFDRFQPSLELASAVAYLHDVGIVHGDIKSDNVIISDDGHVQLGDFGSASLLEYASVSFTKTGFHGTLRFMAPEILSGEAEKPTKESDVYALGMTIFHMMTGEVPFANLLDRTIPIMVAIDKIKPNRPHFNEVFADRPAEDKLWSLLSQCWDYDPEYRPTAIGVKESLLELEHSTIAYIMRMLSDFSRVGRPPKSVFRYAQDPTLSTRAGDRNPSMQVAGKIDSSPPRRILKKALVVGMNYAINYGALDKGVELENIKVATDEGDMHNAPTFNALVSCACSMRYAIQDARGFATTLSMAGYSNENIEVVTDEPGQPLLSREYLLECMDRLVQDALPGDRLLFFSSLERISGLTIQDCLIAKVPEGVELTMVLDFCNNTTLDKRNTNTNPLR
ncbi:kinase domain protein, partial [Rhizoctonia solani AG-3 Rhs1AP]